MEAMKEEEAGGRVVGGPVEGLREWQRCSASWLRSRRGAEGLTS